MNARRARAADLKAVAEIRGLQSRAAEMDAVRAENERRARAEDHERCTAELVEIERGWTQAVEGGRFDPGLARHWFGALETGREEEKRLEMDVNAAEQALNEKRAAWQAASARSDAAIAQARGAAREADRKRDDARLGAVEDRAAARTRPA